MSDADVQNLVLGALQGLGASTVFVLALFIGFCVIVGFTKTKKTAGGNARSSRASTSAITRQPMRLPAADGAARPRRSAEGAGARWRRRRGDRNDPDRDHAFKRRSPAASAARG